MSLVLRLLQSFSDVFAALFPHQNCLYPLTNGLNFGTFHCLIIVETSGTGYCMANFPAGHSCTASCRLRLHQLVVLCVLRRKIRGSTFSLCFPPKIPASLL